MALALAAAAAVVVVGAAGVAAAGGAAGAAARRRRRNCLWVCRSVLFWHKCQESFVVVVSLKPK